MGEAQWGFCRTGEYLGKEKRGLITSGPVMGGSRTAAHHEAFIREGAKVNYRAEWHPGDGAPFFGPERFVKKISNEKISLPNSRRAPLKDFIKNVAVKSRLSADMLSRKGQQMWSRPGTDSSAKPCWSRAILLLRWRSFLLAIRQTSAGRCRRVSRLRQG